VKRGFNLFNRVAFRGGHSRGVIFALAGRNTVDWVWSIQRRRPLF